MHASMVRLEVTRLKIDLHTHSTVSDGKHSPEELVEAAVEKGLDGIAVTDHDSFEGGVRARRYARARGAEIIVLIGAEVRTEEGDILVLCPENPLEKVPRRVDELLDEAHSNECIVIPAHPFDVRRHGVGELIYRFRWDAIEVYNAMSDPWSNEKAKRAAVELGLPGIAGSDAHVADAVGAAYTIVEAEPEPGDIIDAIRAGRVKPVAGRPTVPALFKTLAWSIERRLGLYDRKRMEKLDRLWSEL